MATPNARPANDYNVIFDVLKSLLVFTDSSWKCNQVFCFQKLKQKYFNKKDAKDLELKGLTSSLVDSAWSATRWRPLNFCLKSALIGPFKQTHPSASSHWPVQKNHIADRKCRNFKETSRDMTSPGPYWTCLLKLSTLSPSDFTVYHKVQQIRSLAVSHFNPYFDAKYY